MSTPHTNYKNTKGECWLRLCFTVTVEGQHNTLAQKRKGVVLLSLLTCPRSCTWLIFLPTTLSLIAERANHACTLLLWETFSYSSTSPGVSPMMIHGLSNTADFVQGICCPTSILQCCCKTSWVTLLCHGKKSDLQFQDSRLCYQYMMFGRANQVALF